MIVRKHIGTPWLGRYNGGDNISAGADGGNRHRVRERKMTVVALVERLDENEARSLQRRIDHLVRNAPASIDVDCPPGQMITCGNAANAPIVRDRPMPTGYGAESGGNPGGADHLYG